MADRIMAHLVAGYPTAEISAAAARGLIDGGASYLEVQFPFSDPSADGPLIQEACGTAIENGFTREGGFRLISEIRKYADIPIFIMSYASIVFVRGVERFLHDVELAGAAGVIIPDLMPGYDEGLYEAARSVGLEAVPVVAPTVSDERLRVVAGCGSSYLYTALRTGITGQETVLDEGILAFLSRASGCGLDVLAGFGIRSREQVELLAPHVHAVIVGSEFVKVLRERGSDERTAYRALKERIETLCMANGTG